MRKALLPLVHGDQKAHQRLEDVCNALRVLHAVSLQYDSVTYRSRSRTSMTQFALSLARAENIRQLENILRFKLTELSIPGCIVVLSPYLTERLSPGEVTMVIPRFTDDRAKIIPCHVREPQLLPKMLFPREKQFSATLELLHHNGWYMGYAYLFSGAETLAVYDDVRELLSETLYTLYKQQGKTKPHALIIANRTHLAQSIAFAPQETVTKPGKLQAQDILDYLIDHLDEMCDLDKMATFFQMSKSHLTRRVKALTGYTAQTLHERLKIEQAKDLIKSKNLKMNDIALRLGYSNPNYFSNVFKKVTGFSPLAWAERNRR